MYKILLLKKFIKVDGKNKQVKHRNSKASKLKRFKTSIVKLVFTRKAVIYLLAAAGFLGFPQSMDQMKGDFRISLVSFYFICQSRPLHNLSAGGQGTKLSTGVVIFLLSHRSERQCGLPSFRIRHSKNSNQFTWRKWARGSKIKHSVSPKKSFYSLNICTHHWFSPQQYEQSMNENFLLDPTIFNLDEKRIKKFYVSYFTFLSRVACIFQIKLPQNHNPSWQRIASRAELFLRLVFLSNQE